MFFSTTVCIYGCYNRGVCRQCRIKSLAPTTISSDFLHSKHFSITYYIVGYDKCAGLESFNDHSKYSLYGGLSASIKIISRASVFLISGAMYQAPFLTIINNITKPALHIFLPNCCMMWTSSSVISFHFWLKPLPSIWYCIRQVYYSIFFCIKGVPVSVEISLVWVKRLFAEYFRLNALFCFTQRLHPHQ